MPDEEKVSSLKAVDINDVDLPEGLSHDIDPQADAYEIGAPPPTGNYPLKCFVGRNGFQQGLEDEDDSDSVYYAVTLECKVADGEFEGRMAFPWLSTRVFAGNKTSTMATFINKYLTESGNEKRVKGNQSSLGQVKLLDKILKKEPVLWADLDWDAYSKVLNETVASAMTAFPKGKDGSYDNKVKDRRGNVCYARSRLVRWGKSEKKGKATAKAKAKAEPPKAAIEITDDINLDELI